MAAAMKASRVMRSGGLALRVAQGRCAPRTAPPPCAALWGAPTPGRAPSAGASWTRLGVRGPSLPPHFRRASTDSVPQTRSGGGGGSGPPRAGSGGGGGGGGGGDGGGGGFWAAYMASLDSNPVAVKAVTAGALNLLGDVICQLFFEDGPFNFRRAAIFTALGGILIGPVLHFWYSSLGRIITGTGAVVALKKLVLDQFVFAPVFLAVVLSTLTAAEGGVHLVSAKLKQDLGNVVVANWKLWVPFQFLNFRFVPPQLTVAAANVCAVVWNVILSLLSHAEVEPVAAPASKGKAAADKKGKR